MSNEWGDQYGEYVRRTLERQVAPLYQADVNKPGILKRVTKVLRDALGRPVKGVKPDEQDKPEDDKAGVWSI